MESSLSSTELVVQQVDQAIALRLIRCPYARVFENVCWKYSAGQLTLEGSVPSFYLKQVLQELLKNVEHVQRIVNAVQVAGVHWPAAIR